MASKRNRFKHSYQDIYEIILSNGMILVETRRFTLKMDKNTIIGFSRKEVAKCEFGGKNQNNQTDLSVNICTQKEKNWRGLESGNHNNTSDLYRNHTGRKY